MSHPIPGHDYGENTRGGSHRDLRLNSLQKAMGKFLDNVGNTMKKPNENDLQYLKRIAKGKALKKKSDKSPKENFFNSVRQSPWDNLPPGYKQSD